MPGSKLCRHVRAGRAIFADNTPVEVLAPGRGKTTMAPRKPEGGEPTIMVCHDPEHLAEAVSLYDEAEALLAAVRRRYAVASGPVAADVDRLAGVSNRVMPRFFLGAHRSGVGGGRPGA